MDYYQKYLKYKTKYIQLKEQLEGAGNPCKGKKQDACKDTCYWRQAIAAIIDPKTRKTTQKAKSAKCKQIICKKLKEGQCNPTAICKWNSKKNKCKKKNKCNFHATQKICLDNKCRWKVNPKDPTQGRCKATKLFGSKSSSSKSPSKK